MKSERASDSWLFRSTHHLGSAVGGVSCCLALFCHNTMNSGLDIVRLFWLDGCLMIGEDDCRLHHTSGRLQSHFHHGVDNVAISAGRPSYNMTITSRTFQPLIPSMHPTSTRPRRQLARELLLPKALAEFLSYPTSPSRPLTEPTKTTPMNISQNTRTHTSDARRAALHFPNFDIPSHQPAGP